MGLMKEDWQLCCELSHAPCGAQLVFYIFFSLGTAFLSPAVLQPLHCLRKEGLS